MIIIQASMKAKPGKRDQAIGAFNEAMAGSQAEAGCIAYRFTADIIEPDSFHILEMWEDEAALLAHLGGQAFKGFMAVAGEIVDPLGMAAHTGAMEPYSFPG
jgi:quinol monooxygenase YgiN